MGLRMNDIHAPTVASGPTTTATANGTEKKPTFQELALRKENLEAELSALSSVLDSHGVNMNTSLTTFDGYPRADIDVAQIRTTRARIIRLKNDHKDVMKQLEKAIEEHFAAGKGASEENDAVAAPAGTAAATAPANGTATTLPSRPAEADSTIEVPFAKVNSVATGSPAAEAGLRVGDQVSRFGSADFSNHERLAKVAQVVQQNENRQILVKVLRGSGNIELQLTPRRDWGGRGMLGCHLLPI